LPPLRGLPKATGYAGGLLLLKETMGSIDSIFEVGCALGYNLNLYKKDIPLLYGVEPSKQNVIFCKENYGIDLFNGTFQEYINSVSSATKYDLIFLSHVLEHIVDPYNFLYELSKINKRYMFIDVPCFDYKLSDEPYGMFCGAEHVNFFTFDNLRFLMNKLCYHVVDANMHFGFTTDMSPGYPCLATIWEKDNCQKNFIALASDKVPIISSRELLGKYLTNSAKLQNGVNGIIDSIDNKTKLAVWCVGNHTSRLLGMSNLSKKNIVKFYDWDVGKKNSLYFNKPISPFDANDILNGEVELILISSYISQQSIINTIESSGVKCNYIKLY
jgi:hypothetical protein